MTREVAIDLLDNLIGMVEDNQESDYDTALKMGIQALSQEPCRVKNELNVELNELKPCTDAVSRKSILKYIDDWWSDSRDDIEDLIIYITYLPPVTQKGDVKNV